MSTCSLSLLLHSHVMCSLKSSKNCIVFLASWRCTMRKKLHFTFTVRSVLPITGIYERKYACNFDCMHFLFFFFCVSIEKILRVNPRLNKRVIHINELRLFSALFIVTFLMSLMVKLLGDIILQLLYSVFFL